MPIGAASGFLDSARHRFYKKNVRRIREIAVAAQDELYGIVSEKIGALYREQPFCDPKAATEKIFQALKKADFLKE